MHEDNRGFHAVILQVGVKFGHLHGREHAFVHNGARRQAGDIKIFVVPGIADRIGGAFANDVEFAFKCHGVGQVGTATNENLPHNGFARPGGETQIEVVGGHFAPAEDFLSFFLDNILDDLTRFLTDGPVPVIGHENHADSVLTGIWYINANSLAGVFKEPMWDLHQNASTVARVVFGTARPSVVETDQGFEGHFDDLVGFFAFDIHDKSNATGVAFVFGVVESVLARICHKKCSLITWRENARTAIRPWHLKTGCFVRRYSKATALISMYSNHSSGVSSSAKIASTGHSGSQAPQSMHSSG